MIMMRVLLGAILVLAAQPAWSLNGCTPASKDADKCETGIAKAVGKFVGAVFKCHAQQADAAFKQKPIDDEDCEATGAKSAKGKLDAAVLKLAVECPAGVVDNAAALEAALVSGPTSLDVVNGQVYCDPQSGMAIDPTGEDAGFIPSSVDALKCADSVGKNAAKLWSAIAKCSSKKADADFKQKTFDEDSCRKAATDKHDAATTKLLSKEGCPSCLDATGQGALRDGLLSQLGNVDQQLFVCPGTTTTTTTGPTTTTSTTTTTTGPTTTTSTTTTTTTTTTST